MQGFARPLVKFAENQSYGPSQAIFTVLARYGHNTRLITCEKDSLDKLHAFLGNVKEHATSANGRLAPTQVEDSDSHPTSTRRR